MKTSNRSSWNPLSLVLMMTCSMLFSGCGKSAEQHLNETASTQTAFSYKYGATISQEHGGHTPFVKRTFQNLVINIPVNLDPLDPLTPFTATAEVSYDELSGDKHYVGRNEVRLTGNYDSRSIRMAGTFTFAEIGYWTRPDVDADRKCQYNSTYVGEFVTSELPDSQLPQGEDSVTRLTSQGTSTLDEYYSWDSGERTATDHSTKAYAYVLDLVPVD